MFVVQVENLFRALKIYLRKENDFQQMQIMFKKECIKLFVLCDIQLSFSFKNPQRIWDYSV